MKNDCIENYKKIIHKRMSDKRFNHCENVSKTAKMLAQIYGEDELKAETAGILHDITKEFPKEEQLQIMQNGGIILDDIQKNAPKLWHSISGSVYIKNNLDIDDTDILNAVRFHTTGRANMSLLEKIIFVADFTSAERTYRGVKTMRKLSKESLDKAMIYSFKYTFSNLTKRELTIHHDELFCYNDLLIKRQQKG